MEPVEGSDLNLVYGENMDGTATNKIHWDMYLERMTSSTTYLLQDTNMHCADSKWGMTSWTTMRYSSEATINSQRVKPEGRRGHANRADVMYNLREKFYNMGFMDGAAVYANGYMFQTSHESNFVVYCKVPAEEYVNIKNYEGEDGSG